MTTSTRAKRLQAPATNTTQDYEVTGFGTPTAAICIYSYGSSDDTDVEGALMGYGLSDGTCRGTCIS